MSTTKTFRGRSLEELLPKIKTDLGPDAIVLRRREGLAGGVAGFFQRSYVEVEACAAGEPELEARNDRATAEGLASPAIQVLVEQATPFADALARAETDVSARAQDVLLAAARGGAIADAGLYGPQPNRTAIAEASPPAFVPDPGAAIVPAGLVPDPFEAAEVVPAAPAREIVAPPAPAREIVAPPAAAAAEQRLVAAGLSPALAADVVGEAVAHGLPFAQPRALKRLVRTALARRMPVMSDLGPGPRRIALVGAGGAGKSSAAEQLAAAYAHADADVVVVALRAADGGCGLAGRLEPLGVSVIAAADAEQATRRLARREADVTIVDAPAAGPGDRAAVAALVADLRALDIDEVHLTLPATLSAAAADELASALAPLGLTHVALTHADQTARPGAPVELAITGRRALSYVCTRDGIELADPEALAKQLLP